jgi:hypothetical protein
MSCSCGKIECGGPQDALVAIEPRNRGKIGSHSDSYPSSETIYFMNI